MWKHLCFVQGSAFVMLVRAEHAVVAVVCERVCVCAHTRVACQHLILLVSWGGL